MFVRTTPLLALIGLGTATACLSDDGSENTDEIGDTETGATGDTSDMSEAGESAGDTTEGVDESCASGTFWTLGNTESPLMHPGGDCLGCHGSLGEAAQVVMAGTVYTYAHELDDCNGVPGVSVHIEDSVGTHLQTTTNAAGNFVFEEVVIVPPYSATLEWQGRMRAMVGMQTVTSCNSCHGEMGANGAPGRILAP